eukprot:2918112-Rhodomonas_salina.3
MSVWCHVLEGHTDTGASTPQKQPVYPTGNPAPLAHLLILPPPQLQLLLESPMNLRPFQDSLVMVFARARALAALSRAHAGAEPAVLVVARPRLALLRV